MVARSRADCLPTGAVRPQMLQLTEEPFSCARQRTSVEPSTLRLGPTCPDLGRSAPYGCFLFPAFFGFAGAAFVAKSCRRPLDQRFERIHEPARAEPHRIVCRQSRLGFGLLDRAPRGIVVEQRVFSATASTAPAAAAG